ncbi:MAG: DUF2147 domain-containing protein [Pseudomonadota bacterium]
MRKHGQRVALALAVVGFSAGAAASDPVFGLWLTESRRGVIEIHPCEGQAEAACGTIVWLAKPTNEDGAPLTDRRNPDPEERGRPVCGLRTIRGLRREAEGRWAGGALYDPNDGATYRGRVEVRADGALHLRGYVGIPLFGRSQVWTRVEQDRVEQDRGGC